MYIIIRSYTIKLPYTDLPFNEIFLKTSMKLDLPNFTKFT